MTDFINSTNRNPSIFSDIGNIEKTQINKKLDVKNISATQDTVELSNKKTIENTQVQVEEKKKELFIGE